MLHFRKNIILLPTLFIFLLFVLLFAQHTTPPSLIAQINNCAVSATPTAYQPITISCIGPNATENSETFTDYRFNVVISHGIQTWDVPGYFAADGDAANTGATSGNVWQAHFNPPTAGLYTYNISMRLLAI